MLVPAAVTEVLRRREVVLVAGADCGAPDGARAWSAAIAALAERAPAPERRRGMDLAAAGRTAAALARLVTAVGPEARAVVARSVGGGAPSPALVALAAAPWRAVVTTALGPQWLARRRPAAAAPAAVAAGCPPQRSTADGRGRVMGPASGGGPPAVKRRGAEEGQL